MKVRQEKQGKDPETGVCEMKTGRSRGDPGKIHRSKGFGVQGCRRKSEEEGWWRREQGVGIWARGGLGGDEGEDETRTIGCGGVLGSQGRSDEGDRRATRERRGWLRSEEKRKRNTTPLVA